MMVGVVLRDEVFSCCNCVAVMLSKALYYTMMVDIVSLLESGEYGQLGTSCAFESPTLANEMSLRGVKCVCRINPVWV